MTTGYILYRGPSLFDGKPIALIATGFRGSSNRKTGFDMIQTYIIRDGLNPIEASRTGADQSICGICPHRGDYDLTGHLIPSTRTCYVTLVHGPTSVHMGLKRGAYQDMTNATPAQIGRLFDGRKVRIGTYGDPAAVPLEVWHSIIARAIMWTGYTHAWRLTNPDGTPRFAGFARIVQASCDSEADRDAAHALGFRTFRVAPSDTWQRGESEFLCPASEEAGKKLTCSACKACGGTSSKNKADVMIPVHGSGINAAKRRGFLS